MEEDNGVAVSVSTPAQLSKHTHVQDNPPPTPTHSYKHIHAPFPSSLLHLNSYYNIFDFLLVSESHLCYFTVAKREQKAEEGSYKTILVLLYNVDH